VGVNSAGTLLFLLNQGSASPAVPASISVFSIDATRGLLTPVAGSPFTFASLAAPNPQFLAVSPNAAFFYVSNGPAHTISEFSIGANGTLTELSGSPLLVAANATVAGLTIDPKGQFLYAADSANNKVASFSISTSGTLAAVAGSFTTGLTPVAIAVDSTASFLYSANQGSNNVSAFKISAGALTEVSGSPYPLVVSGNPQPSFLAVDVSNTFLYVANPGTTSISGFVIKPADGTLSLLTESPFQQVIAPLWIVTTQ
jgi:6-phosphogluconolactonase (cycloisomerase 2 family)